jgi:hypothetical protein
MKPTKDAMMPQAPPEKDRTSEAYSEGGLSGEAALDVKLDVEPSCFSNDPTKSLPTTIRDSSVVSRAAKTTILNVVLGNEVGQRLRSRCAAALQRAP